MRKKRTPRQKASTVHKASTFPMGVFIPRDKRTTKRVMQHSCQWCGARKLRKDLYKLRDGPIDWWFCNDEHALDWLDNRHKTPAINDMLRKEPSKRQLGGKSIEQWVSDELSQEANRGDA